MVYDEEGNRTNGINSDLVLAVVLALSSTCVNFGNMYNSLNRCCTYFQTYSYT